MFVTHEEEVTQLVKLYLQNDNLHFVRDTFIKNNPEQLHTVDSVYQTVAQLRTLDINYPEDTQWDVKNLVEQVATEIAPHRFGNREDMKALSLQLKAEAITNRQWFHSSVTDTDWLIPYKQTIKVSNLQSSLSSVDTN